MKNVMFLFLLGCVPLIMLGQSKVKVVTSLTDLAEFTKVVGGDRVEVEHLVRGSQNPHYIDVKPSYMMKLKSADAFVIIGMQLELWAPQIIDGSRNANLLVIDCSKYVQKMEIPTARLDASAGDFHPLGNPHYWLDPENIRFVLQGICEGLVTLSPADQEYFQSNMASYLKKLDQKISEWKTMMAPLKGKKLVTYHSSFSYFAERFGLDVVGYVEPKPGIPPTPSHSAELIGLMREAGVKVIGLEQYYEENTPGQIGEITGATVVRLSTSVEGLEGTDNYIQLMDRNIRSLAAALQ